MKKRIFLYIAILGIASVLFSCEKDETKATLLDNPVVPTLTTVPNMTLLRANGTDTLTFKGTMLEAGFKASTNYYLEACASGTGFANPVTIMSDIQDTLFKISVSDLNTILLKAFPADQSSEIDLRIRAVLVASGSSGNNNFTYSSADTTVSATIYGLPRLDVMDGTTVVGKVLSPLGNGVYVGYVKLDNTKQYTFKDPDTNVNYGGAGGTLVVDGATIPVSGANGYYKINVDNNAQVLTYALEPYRIGLIGNFNSWSAPDVKMDYDPDKGVWYVTQYIDITANMSPTDAYNGVKFRLNDDWTWNLGGLDLSNLTLGSKDNIKISASGNYTFTLTINADGKTGSCTIVKNP